MNGFAETSHLSPITQADFASLLREHASWILSEGKEGRRANLKDTDLRAINFAEAHLTRASFRGADLRGADLTGAQLQEADFTEARLDGTNLTGVNLERSSFASANLERAVLDGANLAYANFMHASLNDASLRSTMMEKAVLRQVQANRALFDMTDMTEVNGREGSFQGAHFNRTLMPRADFRESRCDNAEFIAVMFEQTLFKGATMTGVGFGHSDFGQAIEISQEYKAAALTEQTDRMREQREETERMLLDIQRREEVFAKQNASVKRDKEALLELHRHEQRHTMDLRSRSRWLTVLTLIWLLLLLIVCLASYLVLSDLSTKEYNTVELAIVIGMPALVFLVSLFSLIKTSGAARKLRHHVSLRERKLFLVDTDPYDAAIPTPGHSEPVLPEESLVDSPRKRFGRRS